MSKLHLNNRHLFNAEVQKNVVLKIKTKGHCSKIGEYSQLIINEIFKV